MAKSDGSVRIDTLVDTKGFSKGINTMQKQMGGLSGAVGKLGVTIAATFAVSKLIQFGKAAIDLGSDLQEVQNVVDVTFTTMSDKVNEFAKGAAEAAGLSETMAKRYVGTFGAMAKAFGFAENESYNMATALTQLAGDVASFYNLTQDEAYTKLKSVFTGETESLKDLGVVMTQAALDSFAMAKGWGKTTAAMNENEKVALRFAFVTEKLNAASGDFIRTQDSWANQTRILSVNFDSFKANIGQALINIFTPFLKVINQIVAKIAELSQRFVAFSELLVGKSTSGGGGSPGDALADIESGYEDIADATDKATKAQKNYVNGLDELNIISSDNDSAIGGGITFEPIDTSVSNTNQELKETVGLFDILQMKFKKIFDFIAKPFTDNKEGFFQAFGNVANYLSNIFGKVSEGFQEFSKKALSVYKNNIEPIISGITDDISGLVEKFLKWFDEDMGPVLERWAEKFSEVWDDISFFGDKLLNLIASIARGFEYLWDDVLKPDFDDFIDNVLPALTPAIEEVGIKFIEVFGGIFKMLGYFIDILSGLISFLTGTFSLDWDKAWNGLKEAFYGFINACSLLIEGFVNIFVGSINDVIDAINKFKSFFGQELIPNIPEFDIPELAVTGITKGTKIPPNTTIPKSKTLGYSENDLRGILADANLANTEMMSLLSEIAKNTKDTAEKNLTIGDREIAKANTRGMRSMGYQLLTEE